MSRFHGVWRVYTFAYMWDTSKTISKMLCNVPMNGTGQMRKAMFTSVSSCLNICS